ncbi:MAG TPA: Gfo/Idh/MocA family oxidoreductase [Bryobacteraceae bacterium]|nr:Gfo/Idh/MocA family oxidoreductase [Bryobacteraceae bacterium]
MTKVAVIGAGSFGKNHVRVVAENPRAELVYVVDSNMKRAKEFADSKGCLAVPSYTDVIGKVDAAILAVPTIAHCEVGEALLNAGIDVLVEKPIAPTLAESQRLVTAAERNDRILQVGHLERYNPAILALEGRTTLPLFFEVHRMSVFTLRSLDVDVILDLMIHDLDIVLSFTRSKLKEIRAAGISVLSPRVDIANVRLEFEDGCIANLTASRVSTEKVRKLRLFQPKQYLSLDYATQALAAFTVGGADGIGFEQVPITPGEPLKLQFDAFLDSVETRQIPKLNGRVAHQTLETALAIVDKIGEHASVVSRTLAQWNP